MHDRSLGRVTLWAAIASSGLAALSLAGCDACVYADAELQAEQRFQAIRIADSEDSVLARLGPPAAVVRRGEKGEFSVEITVRTGGRARPLDERDRGSWPPELRFVPSRRVQAKVFVYQEGTVFAHYFLDEQGRVEFLDVSMN